MFMGGIVPQFLKFNGPSVVIEFNRLSQEVLGSLDELMNVEGRSFFKEK